MFSEYRNNPSLSSELLSAAAEVLKKASPRWEQEKTEDPEAWDARVESLAEAFLEFNENLEGLRYNQTYTLEDLELIFDIRREHGLVKFLDLCTTWTKRGELFMLKKKRTLTQEELFQVLKNL